MNMNLRILLSFALTSGTLPAWAGGMGSGEFPAKGLRSVEIRSEIATITVSASSGPAVKVEVIKDDPRYCRIKSGVAGSKFRLEAENIGEGGGEGRNCQAVISIHAPAGLALDLENRMGGVSVNGLSGRVNIDSRMGPVDISGLTGDVKIAAKMGPVSGDACSADIDVNASMGRVALSGLCGSVKVEAGQGSVALDWKSVPAKGSAEVRSRMGGVKLGFPAGSELDLDLKKGMGRVRSEFEDKAGAFPVSVKSGMGGIEVVEK